MTKPRFKLRLVKQERPLAVLSMAEKRARAIAYLRNQLIDTPNTAKRNIYLRDQGTPKPAWGIPGSPKKDRA